MPDLCVAVLLQGKEKFVEQFIGDEDDEDLDKANALEAAAAAGQKTKAAPKPAEHRALFHGNLDDHFRCANSANHTAASVCGGGDRGALCLQHWCAVAS